MFTVSTDDEHWPQECNTAQKQMCGTNETGLLYLPATSLYCSRGVWIHESQVFQCCRSEEALRTTDIQSSPLQLWQQLHYWTCIFTCIPQSFSTEYTVGNEYLLLVTVCFLFTFLLMHPNQNGFVSGGFSFFKTWQLLNIMYAKYKANWTPVVISLDAERTFDQIEWSNMHAILRRYGFGKMFLITQRCCFMLAQNQLFLLNHYALTLREAELLCQSVF